MGLTGTFRRTWRDRVILRAKEGNVAKEDRGFASMDRAKQREIASKGGKAAHQKGTAHEWTSEEARDAGRKGGIASHRRRREATGSPTETSPDATTSGMPGDEARAGMRDESPELSGESDRSSENPSREERWRED